MTVTAARSVEGVVESSVTFLVSFRRSTPWAVALALLKRANKGEWATAAATKATAMQAATYTLAKTWGSFTNGRAQGGMESLTFGRAADGCRVRFVETVPQRQSLWTRAMAMAVKKAGPRRRRAMETECL